MGKMARIVVCIAVIAIIATSQNARAAVWYVDVENTGTKDGTSWETAFNTIQEGVDATSAGDEIWVAAGIYVGVSDPVVTMKTGVDLYGGFAGTETLREQRDWTAYITTIDGEDARRCLLGADDATLSGFTVTRGYATGNPAQGGGMLNDAVSPTVEDCIFQANRAISTTEGDPGGSGQGGAIVCINAAEPTYIVNCTLTSNMAQGGGGTSRPWWNACGNGGNGGVGSGGAIYASGGSFVLETCTLISNLVCRISNTFN